ncbi:MAG TPA: hypothetical protein VEL52_07240 [Candidatus Bathyarchaeia archaeon]|nr:hypothetical protein [Candidatus Bathyarchaeia archaeon]
MPTSAPADLLGNAIMEKRFKTTVGEMCELGGTAAMYNKEREHATVKLTGSIRE